MEVFPCSYFRWCGYFRGSWLSFTTTDEFSVRITKITSKIGVSWNHSLILCFWPIFNSWKWPYYQKELLHYKHEILSLVVLIWKWMGLFLRKKHLLRCCGCLSLLNWIGALTLSLLLKLHPRKLEPWLFVLWSFFLLKLLCIFTNLAYDFAWSTVVMSRLVLLAATWNC